MTITRTCPYDGAVMVSELSPTPSTPGHAVSTLVCPTCERRVTLYVSPPPGMEYAPLPRPRLRDRLADALDRVASWLRRRPLRPASLGETYTYKVTYLRADGSEAEP